MAKVQKIQKLSADTLKDSLWQTLQDVRTKKITPSAANAVAAQARGITTVVRLQIQVAKLVGQNPNSSVQNFLA